MILSFIVSTQSSQNFINAVVGAKRSKSNGNINGNSKTNTIVIVFTIRIILCKIHPLSSPRTSLQSFRLLKEVGETGLLSSHPPPCYFCSSPSPSLRLGLSRADVIRMLTKKSCNLILSLRLGLSRDDVIRMVAKEHFMHFWAGSPWGPDRDPDVYNPFKRVFYPEQSHVSEGSTDLGRDHEIETARLFCYG